MSHLSHLQEAIIDSQAVKDLGEHAWYGATAASKRRHKQHLRSKRLGKFRKGK